MNDINTHYNFLLEFFKYFGDNFGVFGVILQSIFIIIIFLMVQQYKLSKQMIHYTNKFEIQIQTIQQITQMLDVFIKSQLEKVQDSEDIVWLFKNYFSISLQNMIDLIQDNISNGKFNENEIKSIFYRFQVKVVQSTREMFVYMNIGDKEMIKELSYEIEKMFVSKIRTRFENGISEKIIQDINKQFDNFRKELE